MRITGERWDPPHEMGPEEANVLLRTAVSAIHRDWILKPTVRVRSSF